MSSKRKEVVGVLIFGSITAILYFLLFYFERPILELVSQGRWHFLIPVAIAFTFSFFHGQFTSRFWDIFNIKAKQ